MLIKTVKGGLKCLSLPKHRQILGVQAVDQQGKASSPSAGSALGLGCGGKWWCLVRGWIWGPWRSFQPQWFCGSVEGEFWGLTDLKTMLPNYTGVSQTPGRLKAAWKRCQSLGFCSIHPQKWLLLPRDPAVGPFSSWGEWGARASLWGIWLHICTKIHRVSVPSLS